MTLLKALTTGLLIAICGSGYAEQLIAAEPEELLAGAGCGMCHAAQAPLMGPSWTAIADRYRSDADALDALRARTRAGGSGVWGPAPMPPINVEQLSEEDLATLLTWVLGH